METAIRVQNLGKKYILRHQNAGRQYVALRDVLAQKARGLFQRRTESSPTREEFWALRDVSFEIKRGEAVGIIGRNGAGKSTLLKLLSRIVKPSAGRIEIAGRVASLLEVGTGFHPELTGRENIYLNGAIMGMSRAEIRRKFDEIVSFAEVEKFLDTPVKHFSSGMYVRLAFAVAAHLEPEILIVDEVLAVGDAQFQKKCLGKMSEVSSQDGRTVLFVSHNLSAVRRLTTKGIVIEKGQLIYQGPIEEAVESYLQISENEKSTFFDVQAVPRKWLGTQAARFLSFRFDRPDPIFSFGEDFRFIAQIRAQKDIPKFRCSLTVFENEGTPIGSSFSLEHEGISAGKTIDVEINLPKISLAPGRYYCGVAVGKGNNRTGHVDFDVVLDTLQFEVESEEGEGGTLAQWPRNWGCIVLPQLVINPQ